MKQEWYYGLEKFQAAVNTLATGTGTLAERLTNACIPALSNVQEVNLPPDIWDRFVGVRAIAFPSQGTFAEHIGQLPEDLLRRSAREIVSMYEALCRRMPQ